VAGKEKSLGPKENDCRQKSIAFVMKQNPNGSEINSFGRLDFIFDTPIKLLMKKKLLLAR